MLLEAETYAKKEVEKARQCELVLLASIPLDLTTIPLSDRTQKLKDANSEAEKEINEYRSLKEEEFKKFEQSVRHTQPACHANHSIMLNNACRKQERHRTRRRPLTRIHKRLWNRLALCLDLGRRQL